MGTNDALRTLRESLNLSIQGVAEGAKVSFRTVLRAEQGYPLNPGSRQQLCTFYGKTAAELGLMPQRRRVRGDISHQRPQEQEANDLGVSHATRQGMYVAVQNLEQEDIDIKSFTAFFSPEA